MQIIARKRKSGLIELVAVGAACCIAGVAMFCLLAPFGWFNIAIMVWFFLAGCIFILVGVKGWRPNGIALVFTADGITCNIGARSVGSIFRAWIASWRWDEIIRAHFICADHPSFGDASEDMGAKTIGVILELRNDADLWFPEWHSHWLSKRLQKQLGQSLAENVILLEDAKWDWRPEEVAAWINESVNDPASRARWGDSEPLNYDEIASSDKEPRTK